MSAAFVKSAKENIPLAEEKMVHDRFHTMKMETEARKGEHRRLLELGDHRLSGTKYLWLTGQENLNVSQRQRFDEDYTRQLGTGKAWAYKEMLRDLWHHGKPEAETHFFKDWYNRIIHTNIEPLKKVARAIKERLPNVVSYCSLGITNAVAEGINRKIMATKRGVGGYRNRKNFKTAIYFYCGRLRAYPKTMIFLNV